MPDAVGRKLAPPIPWRSLKAMSAWIFGASPQAKELPVKTMREIKNILFRPKLSLKLPERGMAMQTPMENMEMVQPAQRTSVCKSFMKFGKATETTVPSIVYMRRLNEAVAKTRYRRILVNPQIYG